MRRKIPLALAAALLLSVASLAALAALGEEPTSDNPGVIKKLPPGSSCVCTANWDPAVRRAQDGSLHDFSNARVAGCYGYTSCAATENVALTSALAPDGRLRETAAKQDVALPARITSITR